MAHRYITPEGTEELVEPERWQWEVRYQDGTTLEQFGADGVFHRVGEIRQQLATMWSLKHRDDPARRIDFVLPYGAQLVHGYKRYGSVEIALDGTPSGAREEAKVYKFGIKLGDRHQLTYVLPDDRMIQGTRELSGIALIP